MKLFALSLLTAAGAASAQTPASAPALPLALHFSQSPPLQYADSRGVLTGHVARPAIAALKAAGIPFQVRQTPAKMQLVLMQDGQEPACMLGWLQTPERERTGKFSEVVYEDKRPFALTWSGNTAMHDEEPLKDTLTDKNLRAVVNRGASYGVAIDRGLLRYKTTTIPTTADTQQLLDMLRRHSIDYFFITEEELEEAVKASGYPASHYKRIYFSDLYKGYERRLWCSKSVPDETFKRLNAAIVRLRK
ncbi:putative periplasmic substrate-binding protein [Janthinobacterium sp. HH01]|uniref:transporter substrate-binding domain-containing protein n=1 Tax=Janthinobacterium sp. HH01 TaxID=1198452 RepID=UPI0002AEDB19|nr:transporter substrate-binding domain-containing protein [Janthinobacterium sp. HH01]ELX11117.1 putative periplasmic substrate-binding protein [Janthinobacterium sp. HH01]